jgi:putative transposase
MGLVALDFSRPGKPDDNALIELFSGSFKDECLNTYGVLSLDNIRLKIKQWRLNYNSYQPRSFLGNSTLDEFAEATCQNRKSLLLASAGMGGAIFLVKSRLNRCTNQGRIPR